MLEIRPTCENCRKPLPPESNEAMICTFECTFCENCALEVFQNVCPNCGGGFTHRPIRPKALLIKHPPSDKEVFKPVDMEAFREKLDQLKEIDPARR